MREWQTIFRHRGYHMRSHSETRWAEIMDALAIRWTYEPRLIRTRHGWYLPDFYLPASGLFIEVKGADPTEVEREKAADVELETGCPVLFAYGRPEILSGEVFHGVVGYFKDGREARYSTAEIGDAIRRDLPDSYPAYLRAGARLRPPDYVHARDVLEEWMKGHMTRGEIEKDLAARHAPLNQFTAALVQQTTKAEWALGMIASRINHNRGEMGCK